MDYNVLKDMKEPELKEEKLRQEILQLTKPTKQKGEVLKTILPSFIAILSVGFSILQFVVNDRRQLARDEATALASKSKESKEEQRLREDRNTAFVYTFASLNDNAKVTVCDMIESLSLDSATNALITVKCETARISLETQKKEFNDQTNTTFMAVMNMRTAEREKSLNSIDSLTALADRDSSKRQAAESVKESLFAKDPDLRKLVESGTQITHNEKQASKITDVLQPGDHKMADSTMTEINWLKGGKYREFRGVRIWLRDKVSVNAKKAKVSFNVAGSITPVTTMDVKTGDNNTIKIPSTGRTYQFRFLKVGRAGNNFFEPAMWYSVTELSSSDGTQ